MFQAHKNTQRKKNIFISYRERDSAAETGRLVDTLKQHFYEDQVFMDIDKIEPGVDFTKIINRSLEICDVMLAVIGPHWAGKNQATGKSRIMEPNDWVRLEIATALKRDIRVVPVLVDNASLPPEEELPDDLKPLLLRQAYELSNKRWRYDTENLVAFLEKAVGIPRKNSPVTPVPRVAKTGGIGNVIKWALAGFGALMLALVIYYAVAEQDKAGAITPPVHNNGANTEPVGGVDNNNGGGNAAPVRGQGNAHEPPINESNVNYTVDGIWDDTNGLYYLDILQDGRSAAIHSYSKLNGQKTGEGTGTLNGGRFTFQIEVYNVGTLSASTTLSANQNMLTGTLNVHNAGATYSEPLVLNRRR